MPEVCLSRCAKVFCGLLRLRRAAKRAKRMPTCLVGLRAAPAARRLTAIRFIPQLKQQWAFSDFLCNSQEAALSRLTPDPLAVPRAAAPLSTGAAVGHSHTRPRSGLVQNAHHSQG